MSYIYNKQITLLTNIVKRIYNVPHSELAG